jgi:hypothetical protein
MVEQGDGFDAEEIQLPSRLLSLPRGRPEQQEAIVSLRRRGVVAVQKERLHAHVISGQVVAIAVQRKETMGDHRGAAF